MSDTNRKAPVPGERFIHFKNKQYQIVAVAIHSETREKMVIYQALYDDYGVYARPYDMFMSEVDHEKYPEVKQKYRFSRLDEYNTDENAAVESISAADNDESDMVSPILLDFLDAETAKEKLDIVKYKANEIDDQLLDSLAASLDLVIEEGSISRRVDELKNCLLTKMKYELDRFGRR